MVILIRCSQIARYFITLIELHTSLYRKFMSEEKIVVYFDFDEVDCVYDQLEQSFFGATTDDGQPLTPVSIPSASHDLLLSWWKEIKLEVKLFSNEAATYFH